MLLLGTHNYILKEWITLHSSIHHNLNGRSIPVGCLGCFQIRCITSNEAVSILMHVAHFLLSD